MLVPQELQTLTKDLDVAVKCGTFPNLVQLVGICEDKDTLFVALEDTDDCLKQVLLDSRALVHHPVFAQKNSSISTASEAAIFQYLIAIAKGMNHLYNLRVSYFVALWNTLSMFYKIHIIRYTRQFLGNLKIQV